MLKLKKFVKIPLIILAALAGIIILIAIIAPPVAQHYVEKHSKQICNRVVKMEKFRANIFTGKASITKFQSWEENEKDMFLTFDTLSVRINLFKLIAKEVRINEIRLIGVKAPILQNGSTFNFTDIIQHFTKEDKDTTPGQWAVNLRHITLRNGNIIYKDLQRDSKFSLKELAIYIPGIYFGPENTDVGLHLKFDNGGELGLKLLYAMENKAYTLHIDMNKFSIASIQPYLQEFMNIQALKGYLSTNLYVEGNTDHIAEINAHGTVHLHDMSVENAREETLMAFENLNVNIAQLNLKEYNILLDTILLNGLKVNYTMNKGYNTFSQLFKSNNDNKKAEETDTKEKENADNTTTKNLTLKANNIQIANAAVNFTDATMHRKVNIPINNINISAKNFNIAGLNKIIMNASLGHNGNMIATWEGLLDGWKSHKLNLHISNFDLTQASPYCEHYMAYPINHGTFALTTTATINNAELSNQNTIDINKCDIGKKLPDIKPEYNIPLRAGIFVLEDRKENIKIDLPLSGNITSPEFSLKKVIFKAICNLIVKVATGPIDLLANAFGLNADNFKDMNYYIYNMDWESAHYTQMEAMVQSLKEKAGLSLTATHHYNIEENTKAYALYATKRDFYISTHTDKNPMNLSIEDIKAINAIRNDNKDMLTYIAEKTPTEGSIYDKAFALYPQAQMQNMVERNVAMKENMIKKYFADAGINEERINFETDAASNSTDKNTISFVVNYTPTDDDIDAGKKEVGE